MAVIDEINDLIKELKEDNVIDVKQISDTHHTFEDLYFQRVILLAKLCNCYKDLSWRTKKHFDEEKDPMFNDDFMIGINTPDGVVSYHIKSKFWNYFDGITELDYAPKWDGSPPNENILRILSLPDGEKNKKKALKY